MEWLAQRFELSRGGEAHNLRPMEGLRGFAVLLVFLVHYVTLVTPWIANQPALQSFASALHTIGNTGVDLFFVLSGYLIYGTLISRPQPFTRFISRRVERIYPAFIVVFAVYVALSFVFPAESKIPTRALAGATYILQNFLLLPGLFPIVPMITVAWSLSYEIFFYLAIPVAIAVFGLRGRSVAWRTTFFAAAAIAITIYCAAFGGPVRLVMFVSGILLHEAIDSRRILVPGNIIASIALVVGLLATLLPLEGSGGYALKITILFVSFFLLCFACICRPTEWLGRAFSWTPLRWLGNMSYSYYLLHALALKAGFLVFALVLPVAGSNSLLFWGLLPLMFALTLILATVLFLFVERPYSIARAGLHGTIGHWRQHHSPDNTVK